MFLCLDHINGGGTKLRKEKGTGVNYYSKLKQLGFPQNDYRLLCWNCNWGERMGGCPHKMLNKGVLNDI